MPQEFGAGTGKCKVYACNASRLSDGCLVDVPESVDGQSKFRSPTRTSLNYGVYEAGGDPDEKACGERDLRRPGCMRLVE